ncbi:hypothetical protein [Tichowtungia aerotolerans]|uniref:Type 4 fimbrial biogenesis protein PilX N-terminal domain-containing protein n=1 Tax=Tichowtungia aerotolerans TaxID=2697043 RepID=A0A6P1M9V8_9BACT|nr:hypothetical protein [Tichowtungia aerotolerans]QHI70832.1 hypothetical protein GT409_15745 [Tichowtungia aerotolerans]
MMKTCEQKEGFVLTAVMMLILLASFIGGAFLLSARGTNTSIENWKAYDECLLAVQSGLETVNYSMYTNLLNDIYLNGNRRDSLDVLANKDFSIDVIVTDGVASPVGVSSASVGSQSVSASAITVTVTVASGAMDEVVPENRSEVMINCDAVASYRGVKRRVKEVVTYNYNGVAELPGGSEGSVFDNVFFIDNHGFFSGVNCDFNGDVGANLDIDLKYSSIRLNGDAYAGGECTSKKLYKSLAWNDYGTQDFAGIFFGNRVRPALYTDYNRSNTNTYYNQGYAEGVNFYEEQDLKELPFIGPLSDYEEYAIAVSGSASDSSTTVTGVWGDDAGEDAGIGTNDTGCLVLVGTEANPIRLDGVVVARQDIYIKGYYTGQGTLYAGRNVHVLGNLIAVNQASWPHPDPNPLATAAANQSADFLGLCAKGSLIFGDHRGLDTSYLDEPHTASHASDITDASLGYVSYYVDGEPYFDGDYRQADGNGAEQRTDGSLRHFYQPILSNSDIDAIGVSADVGLFDAVLYANHLIAGNFAENSILNGAFICRDESVKRHGNLALNWDARLGSLTMDGESFYSGLPGMMLPAQQPLPSRTIQWAEVIP